MAEKVLAAAIQLDARLGDIEHNLARCEDLADQAGAAGARFIALPEFFTTGVGFDPAVPLPSLPANSVATELLLRVARHHQALVGGSFLCRDEDGHVRNAYLLAGPDGLLGRHDKDLPTMWENALYVGGSDDGRIDAHTGDGSAFTVGAAVCWELMRAGTATRLRGKVDLLMTGSGWWSIPRWLPGPLFDRLEQNNSRTARAAAAEFASFVGAPMVHAAHCGPLDCAMPWLPIRYRGHMEGSSMITDADGTVLAERSSSEGPGVVLAEITIGRTDPVRPIPDRYWLHRRGVLPTVTWNYQRWHGRRWYREHVQEPVD